jgi:hypothetical protein
MVDTVSEWDGISNKSDIHHSSQHLSKDPPRSLTVRDYSVPWLVMLVKQREHHPDTLCVTGDCLIWITDPYVSISDPRQTLLVLRYSLPGLP